MNKRALVSQPLRLRGMTNPREDLRMTRRTLSIVGRFALLACAAVPTDATAQIYGSFLNNIQKQPSEQIKPEVEHPGSKSLGTQRTPPRGHPTRLLRSVTRLPLA